MNRASRALMAVAAAVVVGAVAGCGGGSGVVGPPAAQSGANLRSSVTLTPHGVALGPLRNADVNASTKFTYQLKHVTSCEIGDGLTLVHNTGNSPLTITHVSARIQGLADHAYVARYRLVPVPPGSTTGELAPSFKLSRLPGLGAASSARGSDLLPQSQAHRWYALVADVRLPNGHSGPWSITGLDVTYTDGVHSRTVTMPQRLGVPASTCSSSSLTG